MLRTQLSRTPTLQASRHPAHIAAVVAGALTAGLRGHGDQRFER